MSIDEEEWNEYNYSEEKSLDKITEMIKDALELAREKDEPRDMQMRFLLSMAVNDLESLRYEKPDYIPSF